MFVTNILDSIWKKEYLYGSDLWEGLIEVAHQFVRSNVSNIGSFPQCTVGSTYTVRCKLLKFCTQKIAIGPQNNVYNSMMVLSTRADQEEKSPYFVNINCDR